MPSEKSRIAALEEKVRRLAEERDAALAQGRKSQEAQAEKADELRRALALIEGIAAGTEDMIAAEDGEFRYLFFNDAYRREFKTLWGRDIEVGTSMIEALAPWPEEQRKARDLWSRALAGESFQVRMDFGSELEKRIYDLHFNPVWDAQGRQIAAAHILRNVTEQVRMQQALAESEERFRALVTASSDVVYRMAPDWSEMRQLLGRGFIADTQEPSRNWLLKYIPHEDQPQVMTAIDEAIWTRSTFERAHRVLRTDGSVGWTFSRAIPRLDGKGEIIEWFGTAKDITDRKQVEEEVQKTRDYLQAVLDSVPAGVVVVDAAGEFMLMSHETERILGGSVTGDAHVPRGGYRLWLQDGSPIAEWELPLSQALAGRTVTEKEILVTRADGSQTFILASAKPVRSEAGDQVGAVTVFQDISAMKDVEENLKNAKASAEKASQAKGEFLANMSHEIRTPMTVFMAAIEYLLQIDRSPERRHLLGMAEQSAQRLRSLIDDILDLSRIEARKVAIEEEPFDLRDTVRAAVDLFTLPAREKNLRLEMEVADDTPEMVAGDPDKIGQVLINLIGNAVKFTYQGEIRVCVQTRGEFLAFAVADTGIGIPEEKHHLLFQNFSQVDSSFTRQFGGSGLGLAISKGLVELMGGEISVQSRAAEGSVFTFTIPLRRVEKPSAPAAEISWADSGKENAAARILLAEDEPMIREIITMMLAQRGLHPDTAESGRQAVEKWQDGNFDVIFMDLQMSDMNGMEATQAIRAKETGGRQRTCIIGLTAHASREVREQCLDAGMDQVLTKPVKSKDLLAAVDTCFTVL
ncbi:MAG: response regulator [Desulfuromonadales bacterium]|nr:response regulator [Desulfuromonadales bacterium]